MLEPDGVRAKKKRETLRDVLRSLGAGDAVVYFTAAWCGPCREFGPILTGACRRRGLVLVRVDVDDVGPDVAALRPFRVRGVPAVFAYRARRQRGRLVGAVSRTKLEKWLADVLPHAEEER